MVVKHPRDLISKDPAVPTLPEIFLRLDEAINDPRCSLADLSEIISSDAGLTGRLLRLANSVFYNFPSRIDSITRAMTLVGTRQLRDLVLATSVIRTFSRIPSTQVNMKAFWQHSIAVGVAARVLAIQMRETNVEHFYVAGLLHDIGRLVQYVLTPDQAAESLEHSLHHRITLHEAEQKLMGFHHAQTGQALLEHWQLPSSLSEPVGDHHSPCESNCYPREAAVLHLADIIVTGMGLGSAGEQLVPPLEDEAWRQLQIPTFQLEPLFHQIDLQYWTAVDVFLGD